MKYAGVNERVKIPVKQMNAFIHGTNMLLLSRGLKVANGENGIREVRKEGIVVDLIDHQGKQVSALVKTIQHTYNGLPYEPGRVNWNFSEATEVHFIEK